MFAAACVTSVTCGLPEVFSQMMKFMVLAQITLPIEPTGGRHVYSFRLDGSHQQFDVPLDVVRP